MNPILTEIERDRTTLLPNGECVPVHSHVEPAIGKIIQNAIKMAAPKTACEVGLAYGVSALYILEAMSENGNGHLIGIDIDQHGQWQGGGLHNIQRAGFSEKYTFHAGASHVILPRLAEQGTRIQFGFIDGWHTFDHTLVDFFYMDQMMDVGGVIVLDDLSYPSIRHLAQFIMKNRDYTLVSSHPRWEGLLTHCIRYFKKICGMLSFDSQKLKELEINNSQLVVLKKNGDDKRSFYHFVPF